MTQRDTESDDGWSVGEREERLARARLAFDQGLREASETGARAARRLLVPALWGAALVGGTLLAIALVRFVRRPSPGRALLRVTIEPKLESRPLLPALGGALARFAIQHWLRAPSPERTANYLAPAAADTTSTADAASRPAPASNGLAKA